MMENLLLTLAAVAYVCAGVAYFKWQVEKINGGSSPSVISQKQNKQEPCIGC